MTGPAADTPLTVRYLLFLLFLLFLVFELT